MIKRLWLIFTQITTILVAVLFVAITFKPFWLNGLGWNQNATLYQREITNSANLAPPIPIHSFAGAASAATASVVSINIKKREATKPSFDRDSLFRYFFGDEIPSNPDQQRQAVGSGVILSKNGYIVTNHHVIEGADDIEVSINDGRTIKAQLIGTDPDTDIAVLKINEQNLPNITLAPSDTNASTATLQIGDIVLAIGNPFGVGKTVTMGIVSALGREDLGINTFENFIQTDAAINPGNSGGALVDSSGRLVGINTAIFSRTGGSLGIGFAVPVATVQAVFEELIENGRIARGFLGVSTQELSSEIREALAIKEPIGVLVSNVQANSPAAKAGLKPGDVITKINQTSMTKPRDLLNTIAKLRPGQKINLEMVRNRDVLRRTVDIGIRPVQELEK
jgi:serine protease DegQ